MLSVMGILQLFESFNHEAQMWMSVIGPGLLQRKSSARIMGVAPGGRAASTSSTFWVASGYCTHLVALVFGQSARAGRTDKARRSTVIRGCAQIIFTHESFKVNVIFIVLDLVGGRLLLSLRIGAG